MSFATVVDRVRMDFVEMPEMELTLPQAVRLWSLGMDDCRFVIDALVDAGFLAWTPKRTIVRKGRDPLSRQDNTDDGHFCPSGEALQQICLKQENPASCPKPHPSSSCRLFIRRAPGLPVARSSRSTVSTMRTTRCSRPIGARGHTMAR